MNTSELVAQYLAVRRAHGASLKSSERVLYQFSRETGNLPLADVTPEAVLAFLRGHGELSATWTTRFALLAGLYRFAISHGQVRASALPDQRPKLPPQITPYVYSHDELQRLLNATDELISPYSLMQAPTYRALLLLLYATALRVSEALHLKLADLDRPQQMLCVRETKFYKTRLVPLGKDAAEVLLRYVDRRCRELPMPQGADSALFASRSGHRLAYERVAKLFQKVRARAGIGCPPGERRPPRLHDLRHNSEFRIIPSTASVFVGKPCHCLTSARSGA
jgi:integrase/recombinase XerD